MKDVFIRIPQTIEPEHEEALNKLLIEFVNVQSDKIKSITVDFEPSLKRLRNILKRKCKQTFVKLTLMEKCQSADVYEVSLS